MMEANQVVHAAHEFGPHDHRLGRDPSLSLPFFPPTPSHPTSALPGEMQALTAAARLLHSIAQRSSRAGVAITARLVDRCVELAAASTPQPRSSDTATAGAAMAGQRLDACLHFAALLAAPPGSASGAVTPALAGLLLLCLPRLLPLARLPRASTRRLCLDLFSLLLSAAAQLPAAQLAQAGTQAGSPKAAVVAPPACGSAGAACQSALLAALCAGLADRDANLRAKALVCLERHARLVAVTLSRTDEATAGSSIVQEAGAVVSGALLQALRGR